MKIDVTKSNGTMLVAIADEIVSRDDQQAISDIMTQKLAQGEKVFILDLSRVPYIGSLGIGVLVAAHVKVNRSGGKLRLVNPSPRVARILEITKVADIFRTYASVEEAMTAG